MGEIDLPLSVHKVMLDSGASLTYIPDPEFSIIVKQINKTSQCYYK